MTVTMPPLVQGVGTAEQVRQQLIAAILAEADYLLPAWVEETVDLLATAAADRHNGDEREYSLNDSQDGTIKFVLDAIMPEYELVIPNGSALALLNELLLGALPFFYDYLHTFAQYEDGGETKVIIIDCCPWKPVA